jgi:4-oxalocrotonate tautomerase
MPHVVVAMYPGRSEEVKRRLADAIARDLIEIAGSSEASISIAIEDVAANQWTQRVWRPQIEPNMSALYRKPGYRPSE